MHLSAQALKKGNLHLLGNLTLMGGDPNSLVGRDSVEVKKVLLELSPYQITRDAAELNKWDNQALLDRHQMIVEHAKRSFKPI